MDRISSNWPTRKITDEHLMEVFGVVAKKISGLNLHEYDDGHVLVFTDDQGRLQHVVCNINRNNWACFSCEAADGECAATTFARASNIKAMA